MKPGFAILSLFCCLLSCAAEGPKSASSKTDQKTADKEFNHAIELQKRGKPEEAWLAVNHASELVPGNTEYRTVGEMLRQQIVGQHLENGNRLANAGDTSGAA